MQRAAVCRDVGAPVGHHANKAKCKVGDVIAEVDQRYYRPIDLQSVLGDPSMVKMKLGWTAKTTLPELVKEMVEADYTSARRDALIKSSGFQAYDYHE